MEALRRILNQVHMTSLNTVEAKYKCKICCDTGWIETKEGYKRCSCYEKERSARLWKKFGVNPVEAKRLSDYVPYDGLTLRVKKRAIEYIKNFNNISFKKENNFGLFGQSGAGKSHIVIAIGAALLNSKNPVQVIYMPYLEAMRQLKANVNDDEFYLKLLSRYNKAKLLIIDDLLKDKVRNGQLIKDKYGNKVGLNEADIKHIIPIINYRYFNHLPTVISTECAPDMLIELDEALAGRILEPCGDNIMFFKGVQYNYRMKKFIKKDKM